MFFNLKKPCDMCPFTTGVMEGWLGKERATEIANQLDKQGKTFACHKTVDYDSGEEDEETGETVYQNREKESHCAGALIMMEKLNRPTQMMQIAERLGLYDKEILDMKSPVFDTITDFVKHHTW